ncbi:hypothetical protein [Mesorhizobium wenxiniae]|uniref:Uncharacterized protein n=1 Tax=Mesorhizobium wenxiniae TaxID=2014805 RepID=A0A271KE31_9HYPH|nr:hypothetical protein [Mesorhizobium wenxiniae]PAP94033.1 hypothetical protein CIT31_16845 [Mesorhizobium wenxiniae]
MFKGASDNAVSRDRNRVLNDRANYTHADFEKRADDLSHEKGALIAEKREHEAFFSRIKQETERYHRLGSKSRSRTSSSVLMKFEAERIRRIDRIAYIDRRLKELKEANHKLHSDHGPYSKMSYTDAFYRCAKELLPNEIMQRIDSAAIALLAHQNDLAPSRTETAQERPTATETNVNEQRT